MIWLAERTAYIPHITLDLSKKRNLFRIGILSSINEFISNLKLTYVLYAYFKINDNFVFLADRVH